MSTDAGAAPPPDGPTPAARPPRRLPLDPRRVRAVLEVLACSGVPTQLLVAQVLALVGLEPFGPDGGLNVLWVFSLSIADAVLLIALAWGLLLANGESPRAVFFGRPPLPDALLGAALIVPLLVTTGLLMLAIRTYAPGLHNVPENPLAGLLASPRDAWLFFIVALVAGGVREEIQRAFLLTRFERHLGGATVGLVITSVAFGAGHALQGHDAAIVTGLLGLAWGGLYLRRRSAVAPMVSHAGFNAMEIVRFVVVGPGGLGQ